MKIVARIVKLTEILGDSAIPLSSTERFSISQLIVVVALSPTYCLLPVKGQTTGRQG